MTNLKSYKTILIQVVVFLFLGIMRKQPILIVTSIFLFALPFISGKFALYYINFLERAINRIGFWIKNILFSLLFYSIIFPISFFLKRKERNKMEGYVKLDITYIPSDFEKMW